jgi:hypothetical protein
VRLLGTSLAIVGALFLGASALAVPSKGTSGRQKAVEGNVAGARTYLTVWLRPHTCDETIRRVARNLRKSDLVASVRVTPGEPEEPPLFPPNIGPPSPGGIQVTPVRVEDAERIRAFVHGLPDAYLVDDVIVTRVVVGGPVNGQGLREAGGD